MNLLEQNKSGLIGSQAEIEKLASQKNVSLLVLSDSHGDYDVVCSIIEEFAQFCDAMIFCGDGCADIDRYITEAKTNDKMRENLPPVIATVQGNCDKGNYSFFCAPTIQFVAAMRNVFVAHGNKFSVSHGTETLAATATSLDADLIFFGHTHTPFWEDVAGFLILNPGSCSLPRGTKIPSFAVVNFPGDVERYTFQYFGVDKNAFGKFSFYPINF